MQRALAAVVALSLTGCSFFLKGVPAGWTPERDPDCQPYLAVPAVDAVIGVSAATWAVSSACQDDAPTCVVALVPTVAFLTAAVIGYRKVKKCREAEARFREAHGIE